MIHVIATITTQPGKRDELIAAFQKLAPEVHAEEGCIEYGTAIDVSTPIAAQVDLREDVVTVVEKWESIQALEAHLAAPHMEAFRNSMGDVIAGIAIQVLEPTV